MGTIAARKTADVIDLMYYVLAIHTLALAQAAELRGGADLAGFAPGSQAIVQWVRTHSAPLDSDRPLSPDIQRLAASLEAIDWATDLAECSSEMLY